MNNTKFINAHPELARDVSRKHGGLDWVNKYTNEVNGKITEAWERNDKGELVDVTEKRKLEREKDKVLKQLRRLMTGKEIEALLAELGI